MVLRVPITQLRPFGLGNEVCDETGCYEDGATDTGTNSGTINVFGGGGSDPTVTPVPIGTQGGSSSAAICAAQNGTWANNTCTSNSPTAGGLVAAPNNAVNCAAAGGTWSGGKCVGYAANSTPGLPPTGNALTAFLASLANSTPTIIGAITGQAVTQAQCVAAKGTWNATTQKCAAGASTYTPLLLAAGIGLVVVLMATKGRR